jgi:hypothetical protein
MQGEGGYLIMSDGSTVDVSKAVKNCSYKNCSRLSNRSLIQNHLSKAKSFSSLNLPGKRFYSKIVLQSLNAATFLTSISN